jgi:hypothetical protein
METVGFFPVGLAIIRTLSGEKRRKGKLKKTFDLETRFCSFLGPNPPKKANDIARKGSKFYEVQN